MRIGRMLPAVLLSRLASAQQLTAAECTAASTAAYDNILNRAPDPDGLKQKVGDCTSPTFKWTAPPEFAGKPWSYAGMVAEFRTSPEYKSAGGTKTADKEKGGCHVCAGVTSLCCSGAVAPADCPWMDAENGVLSATATVCPQPQGGWGWTVVVLLVLGSALYAIGGIAYNQQTTGQPALPHPEFWRSVGGLVRDGATFTKVQLLSKEGGQEGAAPLIPNEQHEAAAASGAQAPEAAAESSDDELVE